MISSPAFNFKIIPVEPAVAFSIRSAFPHTHVRTMSRSSSKTQKKFSPAPALAPSTASASSKTKRGKKQSPRDPLKDLNNGVVGSSSNSSNTSIEAPRGCLRFFLSHSSSSSSNFRTPNLNSRPKSLSKTPKSAPIARPSKPSKPKPLKENSYKRTVSEKPISQKVRKNPPPCLYQWQSGKKSSSTNAPNSNFSSILDPNGDSVNKLGSESEELRRQEHQSLVDDTEEPTKLGEFDYNDANFTPLSKLAAGSGLDCTIGKVIEEKSNESNTTKTPPVQASVSPEIQCGSSVLSTTTMTTPVCYGAGHVVSGVTDRRKCRPRGILAVGDNNDLGIGKAMALNNIGDVDDGNVIGIVNNPSVSVLPLPAEASMHWLSSPCNEEEKDQKGDSKNGSCQFQRLGESITLHSPSSSGHGISSDVGNNSSSTKSITDISKRRKSTLISPSALPEFQGFLGSLYENEGVSSSPRATPDCNDISLKEERKHPYDLDGKNSPFSIDSLGSGNVIQTPQSDSSSGKSVGLSWLNADDRKNCCFDTELGLVTEDLQMASFSHNSHTSLWDLTNSSFQFDCLTKSSNSIDFTRIQKILDNRVSWVSSSTLENVSQSQMRISWREGLVSRIFEMDEFDCCRCLSDEEEGANGCIDEQLNSHQSPEHTVGDDKILLTNDFVPPEFVDSDPAVDGKGKERVTQIPCSCAESISTDGGGLVASGDSDWTLCYKNQLFEV